MAIEYHRDGPWDLPEGWVWAALGDVVDVHDGRRIPINAKEREKRIKGRPQEELYPYFGATGQVGLIDGFLFDGEHVLLGEDGAPFLERSRRKSYIATGRFWVNNHAHILSARNMTLNRYLMHYLNYADYTDFVGGTTRLKLTQADLVQIPVPIAPLAEQRRTVARLDELFTEIGDGEISLVRARNDLDTWRRALHKAAVTGELTREWRESNRPNATGSDVVAAATELKVQFGVRSNRRRQADEDDFDIDNLPQIPVGWTWAKLSDFAHASSYGTSVKCSRDSSGIPVLRIPNIRSGRIDLSDIKFATTALDLSADEFLDIGDLLVVRTNGSEDLIGRAAMVGEPVPNRCYFASYLIRFRIVENAELRRWIGLYFESPIARAWVRKNIASSAGQYNISQTALMRMPIPVPPEVEMAAGLQLVRDIDGVRADVAVHAQAADRVSPSLRQSILKAAFEGRLVEQDPREEPADRLLARLSEQCEALPSARRPRRRRAAIAAE